MIADRRVVRLDPRRSACVWVMREDSAWLVLAADHGWIHGSYSDALADACWLCENLGLAVRHASTAGNQPEPPPW